MIETMIAMTENGPQMFLFYSYRKQSDLFIWALFPVYLTFFRNLSAIYHLIIITLWTINYTIITN